MNPRRTSWTTGCLVGGLILGFLGVIPLSARADQVFIGVYKWVIDGYDPVAYFLEGKPVKGRSDVSYEWNGGRWLFNSEEHRQLFIENPEKYAPQYGGFCSFGVSKGAKVRGAGEVWNIVDGKLYLYFNTNVQSRWESNREEYIRRADEKWITLKDQ